MRVAVLKPDHLGDLVLAAPAIAALRRRYPQLTLLCHPDTVPLARHLFSSLGLQPITLPHLDRTRSVSPDARPLRSCQGRFDLLVALRWDNHIREQLEDAEIPYYGSERDGLDVHVAVEQRDLLAPLTGSYDLLRSYQYAELGRRAFPSHPRTIGLCPAAGFSLNAWPLSHWLRLAERLADRGMDLVLLGGPNERTSLRILCDALAASTGKASRVLIGDENFRGFLQAVACAVDLVIASDSGSAHLASLVVPVLSLFGGSPWRRFAPLGPNNAIVTRELPCSPCPQFDRRLMNTCVTRECLANLLPEQVEGCLDAYLERRAAVRPKIICGAWLVRAPWESCNETNRSCVPPARCG